jgi:hypothetical protein
MSQPAGKKNSTNSISYQFKKVSGQIVNYRQAVSRPAGVGYQTILLRDADGNEHLLQNIGVAHSIDPFLRAADGPITVVYVEGQGDGKKDKPFAHIAALATPDGKCRSDIHSLYTFSRAIRAQARLPYMELCRGGIVASIFLIGIPIVLYALWRLTTLTTPVLTEEFSRAQIERLGLSTF